MREIKLRIVKDYNGYYAERKWGPFWSPVQFFPNGAIVHHQDGKQARDEAISYINRRFTEITETFTLAVKK